MTDLLYAAMPDGTGPSTAVVRKRVLARSNGNGNGHVPPPVVPSKAVAPGKVVAMQVKSVQAAHPGRLCQDCTGPDRQLATRVAPSSGGGLSYYCEWHAHPGCVDYVPVRL